MSHVQPVADEGAFHVENHVRLRRGRPLAQAMQ
jgi:hypothetical protein